MRAGLHDDARAGERDNNFDFQRFFLATVVVFAHSFYVLGMPGVHVGSMAVLGFFGISGYLVTQSWQRTAGVVSFLRKRALRIYPGFAAVVLFDHLVVAPLATGTGTAWFGRVAPWGIVREVLTLQHLSIRGVFDDLPIRAVNGSLWSVPYEAVCYLLITALGVVGVLRRRRALVGLAVLVWALQALVPWLPPLRGPGRTGTMVLPFVCAFLAGAALRVRGGRVEAPAWSVLLLLGLMLATAWHRKLVGFVWPVGLPCLLLWAAQHPRAPLRGWGRVGDFSYGLYLYAFPIQQLLVHASGATIGPLVLFVASMLLTLPLAVGSWFLVERPFLRLKGGGSSGRVLGT